MKRLTMKIVCSLLALVLVAGCDKAEEAPVAKNTPEASPEAEKPEAEAEKTEEEAAEAQEGQWIASSLYGVKFRVPEDWEVTTGEEGVSTTSADGSTTVVLVGSESQNMVEGAINDIKANVELKEIRFEKSGLTTINGLAGSRGSGSAVLVKDEGDQEIQFLAYSLRVGKNTVTMMIFAEAEMYEAKKDMIDGIAQTIVKN